MLLQCSFKVLIELHRMFTVTNFRAELRAITLSTLIVHGDNGTPTPLEATGLRTANLIRASQLKIYAGAERVILNPAVDGLFYFAVKHEGRTWSNYGRFALIDRPHKVEYTWMSEAAQGVESVVSVTFEPRDERTEVTLRHSGVPDDEMGRRHKEGWTWVLSMLGDRFAARQPSTVTEPRP